MLQCCYHHRVQSIRAKSHSQSCAQGQQPGLITVKFVGPVVQVTPPYLHRKLFRATQKQKAVGWLKNLEIPFVVTLHRPDFKFVEIQLPAYVFNLDNIQSSLVYTRVCRRYIVNTCPSRFVLFVCLFSMLFSADGNRYY